MTSGAPRPCDASWALAPVSALSDRLAIARRGVWPTINLAAQVVLSCCSACRSSRAGDRNACAGQSDPLQVLAYVKDKGLPDQSCQGWIGTTANATECGSADGLPGKSVCQSCAPTNQSRWPGVCHAVPQLSNRVAVADAAERDAFVLYTVSSYGRVSGVDAIKAEIHGRGPVSCAVVMTPAVAEYSGGVLGSSASPAAMAVREHASTAGVELTGWGIMAGMHYWIGRGSFGTAWGEDGWFRWRAGYLGIERNCSWGVPVQMSASAMPSAN